MTDADEKDVEGDTERDADEVDEEDDDGGDDVNV
jgi:hypothetical protein